MDCTAESRISTVERRVTERDSRSDYARRMGELMAGATEIRGTAPLRRREELVNSAVELDGWDRARAERVHDIAAEERLNPELAFLLVRARIGVCAPPAPADAETLMEGAPDWVDPGSDADTAFEGRLRRSFRRLRGHMERASSTEDGVRSFLSEPDVSECDY